MSIDPHTVPPPAVEFCSFSIASGYTFLLEDLSFRLPQGQSLAVLGPVGSGKSILLKSLAHLVWGNVLRKKEIVQRGSCKVLGEELIFTRATDIGRRHSFASVDDRTKWMPMTIAENFRVWQSLRGEKNPVPFLDLVASLPLPAKTRARLAGLAEHTPQWLEPPLLQQLAVIRALLQKPTILMLDEPFLRMDPVLLKQTELLLTEMASDSTILLATNDLYQASRLTDWILLLQSGRTVEFTPTPQFFTHPETRAAEDFIAGRESEF